MSIEEASESQDIPYCHNHESDFGDRCLRHFTRSGQCFIPYGGTVSQFKRTEAFSAIMEKHDFVLLEPNVLQCTRASRKGEEVKCRSGINISTPDWGNFYSSKLTQSIG